MVVEAVTRAIHTIASEFRTLRIALELRWVGFTYERRRADVEYELRRRDVATEPRYFQVHAGSEATLVGIESDVSRIPFEFRQLTTDREIRVTKVEVENRNLELTSELRRLSIQRSL